jgi:hypothetical protein
MNPMARALFHSLIHRFSSIETTLTRRENILSFLVVRFVLMSGMVLGFSWYFLNLSP